MEENKSSTFGQDFLKGLTGPSSISTSATPSGGLASSGSTSTSTAGNQLLPVLLGAIADARAEAERSDIKTELVAYVASMFNALVFLATIRPTDKSAMEQILKSIRNTLNFAVTTPGNFPKLQELKTLVEGIA